MQDTRILRGMTWSDPRGYDPLVAASTAFADRHPGVEIHWDKRSLQGFESTPVDELARDYDLMIIDHPHVGAIVAEDCLLPFDSLVPAETLEQLASETVGKSFQSYFYAGHQWALPVDAATQVQAIRPDLIDRPARRFDEVLELARDGKVICALRPPHVLMTFFSLMANGGTPFPVSRGAPFPHAAALATLAHLQALSDLLDPACHGMDPINVYDALVDGDRFALSPFGYLYAPYGKTGYRPHPLAFHDIPAVGASGPLGSALGGTGLAISAKTQHPALCAEFCTWVASAAVQRGLYSANTGQPGNALAWADPEVNAAVGSAYAQTRMTHEAAWLRPRHNGYMGFQEEGSEILLEALTGRRTHEAALEALHLRFEASFDHDQ